MSDQASASETEFEATTIRAISCIYQNYHCVVFGGSFRFGTTISKPDLALVAKDFSHWFVIEVELISHSLEGHVLPQVRTFQYGEPEPNCSSILARELGIDRGRAETLIERVPRAVAVIANGFNSEWQLSLRANSVQFLALSSFKSGEGKEAFELLGNLEVVAESLGFGIYSAADRSLRFAKSIALPDGPVQIETTEGGRGVWRVVRDEHAAWVSKERGRPPIANGSYIQLLRTIDGRITLR